MNDLRFARRIGLTTLLTVAVGAVPAMAEGVIHVNAEAAPGGDGASWESAYQDLHDGLADAGVGDSVWVAAGVYAPAGANGDRQSSFVVPGGVSVYGGFAGGESSPEDRALAANETILSGDLNRNDGPGGSGNEENSFIVILMDASGAPRVLDGVTVANGHNDTGPHARGAGVRAVSSTLTIRQCAFRDNRNDHSIAPRGAGLYGEESDITVIDSEFRRNIAGTGTSGTGGGIGTSAGDSLVVVSSRFHDNVAAVGGALNSNQTLHVEVTDCHFVGNYAGAGGGAVFLGFHEEAAVSGCLFRDNQSDVGPGAMSDLGDEITVSNCLFATNWSGYHGVAVGTSSEASSYINCVFSRNGGGLTLPLGALVSVSTISTDIVNCTFSANQPAGLHIPAAYVHAAQVRNSIFWGNTLTQINSSTSLDVTHSIVQDSWPGPNLTDDPLFVQPGADNTRLSFGSPALDAGDNASVPASVVTDLDGNPRIQNGIVDLGAYEGAHEPMPGNAALGGDIDPGETALLMPEGTILSPLENVIVAFLNVSGGDDATAIAILHDADLHPTAAGYRGGTRTITLETSLNHGEFMATIARPFDVDDLQGADPYTMDLTYFDEGVGNWGLAVSANTATSSGHPGPIGDRIVATFPSFNGITQDIGDYGVYWDPTQERGFVWANVDHAADTGYGHALCPSDCAQPPNGTTDMADLIAVIMAWNRDAGPTDIDGNHTVDAGDLFEVIAGWGACTP